MLFLRLEVIGISKLSHNFEFFEEEKFLIKPIHIVPFGKFHRIAGAPPETLPNVKYDGPEEVGGNRKCFENSIRKLGVVPILDVNSNRAPTVCSLTVFCCR